MTYYYEMGDGSLIAEANRGISKTAIEKLQEKDWTKEHGGICLIRDLTEERAIFFVKEANKWQPPKR